jgi:hypothetical protein
MTSLISETIAKTPGRPSSFAYKVTFGEESFNLIHTHWLSFTKVPAGASRSASQTFCARRHSSEEHSTDRCPADSAMEYAGEATKIPKKTSAIVKDLFTLFLLLRIQKRDTPCKNISKEHILYRCHTVESIQSSSFISLKQKHPRENKEVFSSGSTYIFLLSLAGLLRA